jgi:cobalt transporter subunit CbtB
MSVPKTAAATNLHRPAVRERANRLAAGFIALAFGAFLLFVGGFAPAQLLHDAAHDGRHGLSFPCH